MNIQSIKDRLINSKLFKDSFWAVFGNGIGSALMLLAGIVIARFLGKDVYGEYGVVKTTMFYVAAFATFGLGVTSTKYIAQCIQDNRAYLKSIMRDAMLITIVFSGTIALLLAVFAEQIATYVEAPNLKIAFQGLAAVIVFKAITTTQIGILAGFKDFEVIAKNSILSGVFMFILCIPLTYLWGLVGALTSLFLSQAFNSIINYISIRKKSVTLVGQIKKSFISELISFSFPVALQESSYTVCNWAAIIFLTKFSSTGELGLYSAAAQWNAVIMMIPGLLNNVILSYLSSAAKENPNSGSAVKRMLLINLISVGIPFIVVFFAAPIISKFYGPTFIDLPVVLRVLTFSTIMECVSTVFKSELLARGRTWLLFSLRSIRDVVFLSAVYYVLSLSNGISGALCYSWINVAVGFVFFCTMWLVYIKIIKR